MARCEDCIHEKVCVIKAFPDAFENTKWEIKPCNHFMYNTELAPKVLNEVKKFYVDRISDKVNSTDARVAREILYDLKHKIHEKAVRPNNAGIDAYISLKVFDAIIQDLIQQEMEKR